MQRKSDNYEENIEYKINNILDGKTLTEWCRDIGNSFLKETNQKSPPFAIVKYLPFRRIEAENDNLLLITAKIERTRNGFLLKINPSKFTSEKYYNFVLAHEIAHTFFYNLNTPQPTEVSGFSPTSSSIEYLCNKIARYLVIPAESLESELSRIPSIYSAKFNLYFVNDLLKKYQVNPFTLLSRMIVDEPIWNAVFVQFSYNQLNNSWELISVYYPRYLHSSKFYIPNPSKQLKFKNLTKRPTAKNSLLIYIQNIYADLKYAKRLYKTVSINSFIGQPLHSIIKKTEYDKQISLHMSLDEKSSIINFLIPIDEKIIGSELHNN